MKLNCLFVKGYEEEARFAGISKQSQFRPKPMLRWASSVSHG
jgi:hypothetical protein